MERETDGCLLTLSTLGAAELTRVCRQRLLQSSETRDNFGQGSSRGHVLFSCGEENTAKFRGVDGMSCKRSGEGHRTKVGSGERKFDDPAEYRWRNNLG